METLPAQTRRRTLAFWLVAVTGGVVMFASAAPSPLYPVYQQLWGFSAAMLLSLLTVGVLSDHVGRRPVIATALACLIAAMIVFATAGGLTELLIARIAQGLATGAALGTLSAALTDLQPSRRAGALVNSSAPFAGLAIGVVVSALLVQYAPAPRQLVYEIAAAALAVLAMVILAVVPETSRRAGFSSPMHVVRTVTPRVSVPREVRAAFIAGVPALIATWALAGLILSLGSSIVAAQLGVANHAADGALLSGFFFAAAAAGPIIAGIGFSTAYTGVLHSVAHVPAHGRGQLFAALYVVSYLAFSIPAIVGGVAADSYGLSHAATGYTIFIVVMVALAAGARLLGRASAPAAPAGPAILAEMPTEIPATTARMEPCTTAGSKAVS